MNSGNQKQQYKNIFIMNYEIPSDTVQLINNSRAIAQKYQLAQTDSLCILLSVLENGDVQNILQHAHVDEKAMLEEIKQLLTDYQTDRIIFDKIDPNVPSEILPPFDTDCTRILKLLVLEDKLTAGKKDGAEIILRALMHDRNNTAKNVLDTYGLNYDKMLKATNKEEIKNDFNFPDEDDVPYPNDDFSKRGDAKKVTNESSRAKTDSDTPIIDNFGTDLTAVAAKGGLDPVVGRENEIQRVVQILCRRKKNNPIIIGEPGVGKSAIVEGLASRIAQNAVPYLLLNKRIVALDMASVVAGTQYRGQFEERLRRLIKELKSHPEIVLFIDEIHTIIGAGSAPGSLDAANILKPALAKGEVQCIGATTIGEFKKSIEKDGALDRRFQKVMLEPTSAEETLTILHNIKSRYEHHHNVTYTDDALKACVDLTTRYVTDRALPDKAIDAMDEAGARMHLAGTESPHFIEEKNAEIEKLRKEKMEAAQNQDYERAANLRDQVETLTRELEELTQKWQKEQQDHPCIVDEASVAEVVSMMSGVPATRVASSESDRLKGMRSALNSRVIAQEKAVERLSRAIARSRIGLKSADRPIGTFLFVGPTGVGKTHLVKCLAEWMFGSKDALIRVDMSEYGEKYSVSRLVGAPPGYVGYEEGGQLTERVRRHPYSVILLDEIEKAHPDVFNTLLQVMDEGRLTDGNGTTVDFRNTIIILTSNSGTRQLREFGNGMGFERVTGELSEQAAESIILKVLRKQFAPEFLNRLDDIIMFNPLNKTNALHILDLELDILKQRLLENGYKLSLKESVREFLVNKGFDAQYGARSLKRAIQHHLEDTLCDYMMEHPEQKTFEVEVENEKLRVVTSNE